MSDFPAEYVISETEELETIAVEMVLDDDNNDLAKVSSKEFKKKRFLFELKVILVSLFVGVLLLVAATTSATLLSGSKTNLDTLNDSSQKSVHIIVNRLASKATESVATGINDFTTTPLLILGTAAERLKEIEWNEQDVYDRDILSVILSIVESYQKHPKLDGTVSSYITYLPQASSDYLHLAGMATPNGWAGGAESFLWGESTPFSDPSFKLMMHPRNSSSIATWRSPNPITMFNKWTVTSKTWFSYPLQRPTNQLHKVTWAPVFFQDCIMKLVQPMVQPIMYKNGGGVRYLLVFDVEIEYFSRFLRAQVTGISSNTKASIVESKSGREIAHSLSNYNPCIFRLPLASASVDPHIRHSIKLIQSQTTWSNADGYEENSVVNCPRGCRAEYSPPAKKITECGFYRGGRGNGVIAERDIVLADGVGDTDGDATADGDATTADGGDGTVGDADGGDANTGDTADGGDNYGDATKGDGGSSSTSPIVGPLSEAIMIRASKLSDAFGLDWTTVIIIPRTDFYFEIEKAQDDAQDRMNEITWISMGVVVGVLLGAGAAILLVTGRIAQPILNLKDEMARVAVMELGNIDRPSPSSIKEINSMQSSFQAMVGHLVALRAFLPESVLTTGIEQPPDGNVGIVFTDIVSSTVLWDRAPAAMNVCLEIHNSEIRKLISKYGGYEVKTIGDAFFITFQEVTDAAKFGLGIHERFVDSEWDPELGLPPISEKDTKNLIWNGIVIRVGVTYGEVISERNPLTGRGDYRGTPVNLGARLESAAKHGCVCMDGETFRLISRNMKGLQSIKDTRTKLKGLSGSYDLFQVSEQRLSGRLVDNPVANDGTRKTAVALKAYEQPEMKIGSRMSAGSRITTTPNVKTDLVIKHSEVSIAVIRIKNSEENFFSSLNTVIRACGEATVQTNGSIEHVHNTSVVVSWNASKGSMNHRTSCLLFAQQVQPKIQHLATIGVCSSSAMHGVVGSQRQKFYTVVGLSLQLAESMAEYAYGLQCFILQAELKNETRSCNLVSKFLIPIDRWRLGNSTVTVSVVCTTKVGNYQNSEHVQEEDLKLKSYVTSFDEMMEGGPMVVPPYLSGVTKEIVESNFMTMTTTGASEGFRIRASCLSHLPRVTSLQKEFGVAPVNVMTRCVSPLASPLTVGTILPGGMLSPASGSKSPPPIPMAMRNVRLDVPKIVHQGSNESLTSRESNFGR